MEKLILIHGALGAADQMINLKQRLEKDYAVEIIELDGHGSKSAIDKPFSLDSFVSQLNQTIEKYSSVHIFGYSMGGFIALICASQGNSQIQSITTLGTKLRWSPEIAEQEIRHLNPKKIKEKVPAFAQALEKRHGKHWEEVLHRTADFMRKLGEEDPIDQERMCRIDIPVQMCLADQDQMVSVEETQEMQRWIPKSEFKVISDSKHPIEQVSLDEITTHIKGFVKST